MIQRRWPPGGYNVPGETTWRGWMVSPALNQVSGSGKRIRVEPKAMPVLIHLAELPGVINRDELISAVWRHLFVSDDVLPGCVSALRKASNDNGCNPQVIERMQYIMVAPRSSIASGPPLNSSTGLASWACRRSIDGQDFDSLRRQRIEPEKGRHLSRQQEKAEPKKLCLKSVLIPGVEI